MFYQVTVDYKGYYTSITDHAGNKKDKNWTEHYLVESSDITGADTITTITNKIPSELPSRDSISELDTDSISYNVVNVKKSPILDVY